MSSILRSILQWECRLFIYTLVIILISPFAAAALSCHPIIPESCGGHICLRARGSAHNQSLASVKVGKPGPRQSLGTPRLKILFHVENGPLF